MRLWFLGGADEVGASCTLLEVAGHRILIDAGIRMQGSDRLPNLSLIHDVGAPEAILVTHAHTDHIGALPQVHALHPAVPIVTTEPTRALMRILLFDALKIMESRWGAEAEVPLYSEEHVTSMLGRLQTVVPGEKLSLFGGKVTITFTPSGHILGCCSILLESTEGTVLFTGDYSVDAQRTVEGMYVPRCRPDLVVTESTYGNRMHANREAEERRLAESVGQVIAGGGKVLIPAFALGRAQEVILILLDAQKRGLIQAFPIFVDGMVRSICSVYAQFPEFLATKLRRQVAKSGNPFFAPGGSARRVVPAERKAVVEGPPCAIVSSSGMLTGGPSQYYAAELAREPKNAIFITGYQDEESPGRRILDVAEGKEDTLRLAGQTIPVACRVGKYNLSAHADAAQMVAVLGKVKPDDVCLVHGDPAAREALANLIPHTMRVHLVKNGECLELSGRQAVRRSGKPRLGLAPREPFDSARMREHLLQQRAEGRLLTAQELAELWYGSEVGDAVVETVRHQLSRSSHGIVADRRRPYLFRVLAAGQEPDQASAAGCEKRRPDGRLEQNEVLGKVAQLFADCSTLYRKGIQTETGELLLHFHFPQPASQAYAERFSQLEQETGWRVRVSPSTHQGALVEAAQALVAQQPGWRVAKTPSVHHGEKVVVKLSECPDLDPGLADRLSGRYQALTGHALELQRVAATPASASPIRGDGRLEQNVAFTAIRRAFQEEGIEVHRASLKTDPFNRENYLEVSLISPQVAERHREVLEQLEQETRWSLRFHTEPNQDVIKRRAKELIPSSWGLLKEPGFFKSDLAVRVKLSAPPSAEELRDVSDRLVSDTGYRLELA